MKSKKETAKYIAGKAGILIIGSFLYGLAINMFLSPGGITMGGFTGISTTLNRLFYTPIGFMTFLLNLPLFAIELRTGEGKM